MDNERFFAALWTQSMLDAVAWQDAAEFEGHVVARLARMMLRPNDNKYPCRDGVPDAGCMRDKTRLTGPHAVHCEDCILREVRFEIEEAMDGHNNA